jgi:hypothetical protein
MPVAAAQPFHSAGGHSRHHRVAWHIARDHRAGPDNAISTDGYAAENRGVCPQGRVLADDDPLTGIT